MTITKEHQVLSCGFGPRPIWWLPRSTCCAANFSWLPPWSRFFWCGIGWRIFGRPGHD